MELVSQSSGLAGGLAGWLGRFGSESLSLLVDSAPFLLVGFALAGLLKVFVPARLVTRHLGRSDLRSVILAALYGTPIPLCSCSVLPTATALRRAGASRGATTSFLISTPETGVDSVSITWALFDPILTVTRPIVAFLTAVITGSAVNLFERDRKSQRAADSTPEPAEGGDACGVASGGGHDHDHDHERGPGHDHDHDHDADEALWTREIEAAGPLERMRLGLRYAFGPLIDDITPWLFVGFLISGVIAASVPASFFAETMPRGWPALLLMAVAGTPLYVCATASTPIAATLVAKGLEPGAALVFLLVGPATNAATLAVVGGLLGRRVLWIYVSGIVLVALGAGAWINALYASLAIDLSGIVAERASEGRGVLEIAASLVFAILVVISAARTRTLAWLSTGLAMPLKVLGLDPRSRLAHSLPWLAVAALWISSAATTLEPGEVGFRLRFGRLVETLDEPGLQLGLPWPIERVERVRTREVFGVLAGLASEEQSAAAQAGPPGERRVRFAKLNGELEAEAQMLTADEVLLSISYSVHFRVRDARSALFGLEDPTSLVRALASSTVRQSAAARPSSEVLVGSREVIEAEAGAALQRALDGLDSGLEVVGVWLRNVHAPSVVHPAFRDVASALEDRERAVHEAEGYRAERVRQAAASAWRNEQDARAEALEIVAQAQGQASALEALAAAYQAAPQLTTLRLWLETVEAAMGEARIAVPLGAGVEIEAFSGWQSAAGGSGFPGPPGPAGAGAGWRERTE